MKSWIFLAYASLFVLGLSDNIRGPIFTDLTQEFGLSQSKGALFFSVSSGMTIVAGYLAKFIMEKWGPIAILRFSLGIYTLAQLGIWFSPAYWVVLMCIFFFGAAMGFMGVGQNVAVIEASPPKELRQWLSGLHSMYGAASFLAPLLVSGVASVAVGWRHPFLVTGLFSGIFFIISFFVPMKKQLIHHAETKVDEKSRHFEQIFFALAVAFYVGSELLISTRLPQYLREVQGYSLDQAAVLTSGFFAFLLAGRVLFIFWKPKVSLKSQMVTCLAASILFMALGFVMTPYFFSLVGIAMAPYYPLALTSAGGLFPRSLNAVTSYSIALSGLMIVAMHSLYGVIGDMFGIDKSMMIGPFFSLMALGMILMYQKIFNRVLG
ncbi:MAG: hypothetical protein BroJett040_23170 [Oligoflexia bacterium]|nr:MAG: hypothetical protein BroJett040_23170 [Oligoflexia bacterium]